MELTDRIAGAQRLLAVFGYWPSFHDAEVLWIRIDRKPLGCGHRPTLDVMVHTFEMTSEVDSAGFHVLRNHVLVHLRFLNVAEIQLDGFNHQNALMGLALTGLGNHQPEQMRFEVQFDPAFGLNASFMCHSVEVVSVDPCTKDGNPL